MTLLLLSLAPVIIIAFYIYFRDKYEKEPLKKLLFALLGGAISVIPILIVETILQKYKPEDSGMIGAAWDAFVVAGFTEELFKLIALYLIIWKSKDFNELFDGIVYAVFVSLGFATVENVLYVVQGGMSTGLLRAVTAVPGHALFGVVMGFHFSLAKFGTKNQSFQMLLTFFMPFVLHGIYDFMLFSKQPILLLLFIPYLVFMWVFGFRRMRSHVDASAFKNLPTEEPKV